jgi:hypothetical protein
MAGVKAKTGAKGWAGSAALGTEKRFSAFGQFLRRNFLNQLPK